MECMGIDRNPLPIWGQPITQTRHVDGTARTDCRSKPDPSWPTPVTETLSSPSWQSQTYRVCRGFELQRLYVIALQVELDDT